jgi:hypothetical protein
MVKFWDWIDERAIIRRVVLFVTLWMTWRSFTWAAEFANSMPDKSGMDMAAIIAAVTAPITYLQASVFNTYSAGRKKEAQSD